MAGTVLGVEMRQTLAAFTFEPINPTPQILHL